IFYEFTNGCPGHRRMDSRLCGALVNSNHYWYSGYVWAADNELKYLSGNSWYVGVPYELAADRLAKLLIDRLRGDL
ncbi:MAG: hypothetical protein Q8J78_10670, partial [Moraxellaceae bacterium]|nr:hypothetical protein [Moraxellaceae bacterium]